MRFRFALVSGVCVVLATVPASAQQASPERSATSVTVVRMYGDASGETHLAKIEMPFDAKSGRVEGLPATGTVRFTRFSADLHRVGATSDSLKYLVVLGGAGFEIQVSDGSTLQFRPGSILLTDDMKSKGHTIRALGGESLIMYVTIDPNATIPAR